MTSPRYPIGPFVPPTEITKNDRDGHIDVLEAAPDGLRAAVAGLSEAQLDCPTATAAGRCAGSSITCPIAT